MYWHAMVSDALLVLLLKNFAIHLSSDVAFKYLFQIQVNALNSVAVFTKTDAVVCARCILVSSRVICSMAK